MKTVVWFGFVLGALSAAGRVIVTKTGGTATLDCEEYKRTLEWTRENQMIVSYGNFPRKDKGDIGQRSTVKQHNLVITGVKPTDAGSFTCKADGKVHQRTLVVVSVSAKPSGDLQPGSKVELDCEVNGLHPGPTIQWKRPGGSLLTGSKQTVGPMALSDAGTWVCTFTHGGETHSVNLDIMVKELATTTPPPVSSKNPKNSIGPSCTNCGDTKPSSDLLLGLSWWMWVVIGVGCLVVILLMVLVIVLCKRIKRRKRKLHKMKNGRQLLTPRQYCQCNRPTAAAKPQQGRRREKPSVPPLQPLLME